MQTSQHYPEISHPPQRTLIATAWVAALLVSSLFDIIWFELTGAVPIWLLWVKLGLLTGLLVLSWFWKQIRALRPFFIILLAITTLMRAYSWLLEMPDWNTWQTRQPFQVVAMAAQLFEVGMAVLLIAFLFMLRKRSRNFFLVRGDVHAMAEPVRWLGKGSPGKLLKFGSIFTGFVIVSQFFIFILPYAPTAETLRSLVPLLPVILLLAAANGFTEEIILRAAPIATVYEVVGKNHANWMAAVLFGLAHYMGGIPSGIPGVLITVFLGWFFGKCMLESKGFFLPWLFHTLQDILPFTLLALAALSRA
jgi:membrane protease YdiL (CAAX protease family)